MPITKVDTRNVQRIPTGFGEFDRVLGGGVIEAALGQRHALPVLAA